MDNFWGNIFSHRGNNKGLRDLLRQIPLFTSLSDRELGAIEQILHEREYRPNEEVFRQGEPGIGMYIIQSGTVVIQTEPAGKVLAELGEGEFFGELALLEDSPRSATAIAKTQAKIFGFSHPDLFGIIERTPHLGVKIVVPLARIIGERLKKTNEHLNTIGSDQVIHHA